MGAENCTSERNAAGADETQTLRLACERVVKIRRALETPAASSLDETVPSLAAAIADLRAFCAAPPAGPGRPELLASALEIQRQVAKLQALLDACGGFAAGWAAVVWGLAGAYAVDGSQAPRMTGRRVSLEG